MKHLTILLLLCLSLALRTHLHHRSQSDEGIASGDADASADDGSAAADSGSTGDAGADAGAADAGAGDAYAAYGNDAYYYYGYDTLNEAETNLDAIVDDMASNHADDFTEQNKDGSDDDYWGHEWCDGEAAECEQLAVACIEFGYYDF